MKTPTDNQHLWKQACIKCGLWKAATCDFIYGESNQFGQAGHCHCQKCGALIPDCRFANKHWHNDNLGPHDIPAPTLGDPATCWAMMEWFIKNAPVVKGGVLWCQVKEWKHPLVDVLIRAIVALSQNDGISGAAGSRARAALEKINGKTGNS